MPPIATNQRLPSSSASSPYIQRSETGQPWSQRVERDDAFYTDMHGREWYAPIEKKTGHPCGIIEPSGWTAPLMPPQKYLRRNPDRRKPTEVEILYLQWIEDEGNERRLWEARVREVSRKIHGDKYDEKAPFAGDVIELVGPPPMSIIPIQAAMQGNPYVLGLTTVVDRRLEPFFREAIQKKTRFHTTVDYSVLDPMEELEEAFDPDATGGQRVAVRSERQYRGKPLSDDPEAVRRRNARQAAKEKRQQASAA